MFNRCHFAVNNCGTFCIYRHFLFNLVVRSDVKERVGVD